MKISVIVPVGNMDEWAVCERSIRHSINAYNGCVEAEILPCYDLEHRGAYVARNEGLEKALGDWIAWVDCDDMVEENWFSEIADAIEYHADSDIIQFDAVEIRKGKERFLSYNKHGYVSGVDFSRELLRNTGMPAWLWTRVFRRELFAGENFYGNELEDYRMFISILPHIKHVWSIGKVLYRYNRHGCGLSSHFQCMDYQCFSDDIMKLIKKLPRRLHRDALIGLALTMADVTVNSKANKNNAAKNIVRELLLQCLTDFDVPFRLKIKCILAAFGVKLR